MAAVSGKRGKGVVVPLISRVFREPLSPLGAVAGNLGRDFAERLVSLSPNQWSGPIASSFGLHLVRFAGALKQIGLPQSDVPLSLLAFNLGIEAGQLAFVAAVLTMVAALDRLRAIRSAVLRDVTACGIGLLAAVWFVERFAAIV